MDLASGRIDIIAEGSPDRSYYRPRHSPEGSRIAVGVQGGNGWRTVLVDPSSGTVTDTIGPDDGANRFDAAWMPDGRSIVLTSSAGGLLHLERITLASGEVAAITQGTGAAVAPEPDPTVAPVTLLPTRNYFRPNGEPSGPISSYFAGEATSEVGLRAGLRRDVWASIAPDTRRLAPRGRRA